MNDMRAIVSGAFSDLGRYAEPSLTIMVSLSAGPKHGWAIMDDSETIGGRRIGAGTLYAALARLERLGMIEPLPADGSRRRPYRLTGLGATTLKAQLESLRALADTGLGRLDGVIR
jgi:DNA-binding PadR family transcriptional regulator